MTTPEERRQAQLNAIANRPRPGQPLDRLLDYFDETEPAVADAIRYGVREVEVAHYPEGCYERYADKEWAEVTGDQPYRLIDYPPGHPKS
jgi:hypothetical protein